jgi:hypothetical protein
MPSAQKSTTPIAMDLDVMEGRYAELGDYTVGFETYKQTLDAEPYFRGLPDDRLQLHTPRLRHERTDHLPLPRS